MRDIESARDWGEARRLLLDAPTSDLIESHAVAFLSRSLNLRPPIAFVGAGASMAYGRISWRDAVIAMQEDVLREAESHPNAKVRNSCRPLIDLLRRVKIERGRDQGDSRDFLITFQLSEQLDKALGPARPSGKKGDFRERLKALLGDDLGHAQHILDSAIHEVPLELDLARKLTREDVAAGAARDIRSTQFFRKVAAEVRSRLTDDRWGLAVLEKLESFADAAPRTDLLKPYHRFVIGAALRLVAPAARAECLGVTLDPHSGAWAGGGPFWDVSLESTAESHPLERDPLRLLRRNDISRFLTTNYDREIDRRFELEGLTRDDAADVGGSHTRDMLARRWRAMVFDRHHVGQMLAFAARDGRRLVEVVHLHGRAEKGHDLVVTNEDYQKHYLSVDDHRAGMEDALAAAFGGNAILFVGSGMGEDDLLRPLRQFVGDHVPGSRRLAIAIVPADKRGGDRACDLEKLRNLQRYGVYTLHTGHATFGTSTLPPRSEAVPGYWLSRLAELRRRLDAMLLAKEGPFLQSECNAVIDWMKKAFGDARRLPIPEALEEISREDFPGLDLAQEVSLINGVVDIAHAINDGDATAIPQLNGKFRPWASALQTALEGCMDSITGAFLCARLLRMDRQRLEFANEWLRLPVPENPPEVVKAAIRHLQAKTVDPEEPIWRRHAVVLAQPLKGGQVEAHAQTRQPPAPSGQSMLSQDDADWSRFYAGAPSQTFNHLLSCLIREPIQKRLLSPPSGRRIFVFIARRGVGKGHFFAALSSSTRLRQLRKAIGNLPPPEGSPEVARHWPAAFFNLGVSHEVTSIFDQLPEVLLQAVERIFRDWEMPATDPRREQLGALRKVAEALASDRIGRLRQVLLGMARGLLAPGQRIIVGLNGLAVLFDRDGYAKNAQLERLFELLWGSETAQAPIDLILVSGERRLPKCFRSSGADGVGTAAEPRSPGFVRELEPERLSPRREAELENRRVHVAILQSPSPASRRPEASHEAYVHFLASARASIMLPAYFPSVALAIALDAGLGWLSSEDAKSLGVEDSQEKRLRRVHSLQFNRANAAGIRKRLRLALDDPQTAERGDVERPKALFPKMLAYAALHAASGSLWQEQLFVEGQDDPRFVLPQGREETEDIRARLLPAIYQAIDERMKALFIASGRSRYGLTVLACAAYQELVVVAQQPGVATTPLPVHVAIAHCVQFLREMQLRLEGRAEVRRVETIFESFLRKVAAVDQQPGRPLPGKTPEYLTSRRGLFEFQRAVLWQIAVIGQPVIAEVLARAPLVMRFWDLFKPSSAPEDEAAAFLVWSRIVEECLELLRERCLVFAVRTRAPGQEWPRRYMIHHQLQLHIFTRLHAPFVEYPEADQFLLTLFACQPNDVPRLTAEARADLYRTVSALIGYPEADLAGESFPSWPPLLEASEPLKNQATRLSVRSHLLRAALGMVRSVYSLSTIARAVPESPVKGSGGTKQIAGEEAVLEQHRLLMHWMIRQAVEHDRSLDAFSVAAAGATVDGDPILKPFYAEEIAWLYNEVGVLCYAQGRMLDSRAFYDRAAAAAKRIESAETGAIRTRIALNGALTDIERGRLTWAESALALILTIRDEHPVVLRLASGMLGLVNQLRGRYAAAEKYFKEALYDATAGGGGSRSVGLLTLKQTRAASIVCRHYGDLMRAEGRLADADQMLRQSATLAIEGGHEDIRHQARLSALRLKLGTAGQNGNPHVLEDGHGFHKELDVVEEFAGVMGMPRLQCEVDSIRAFLRQSDGDLQAAATVASRGLTLASANDLRLRKTRFLLQLAEIFERRGEIAECRAVLAEAFDLAREADYHSAREQGQALYARITRTRTE